MISYNNLRHLLVDKNIDLNNLCKELNISRPTKCKIDRNEFVNMEILERIAIYLDCDIGDIVSIKKSPTD